MKFSWKPIILLVLLAIVVQVLFIAFKWSRWGYTGLDLAIYTQAMDQTVHGHFMHITIHPHSYFGDHVELILLLLVPFYAIAQSPITLLVLQAIAVCSGAFAVVQLARQRWTSGPIPLLAAAAYLLNPFVLNPMAYEFHALTFAIPLFLWVLMAYDRERWKWFLLGLGVLLLVREDVGLATIGLGLMAWVQHRSWRWRLVPMIVGLVWILAMTKLAGSLNGDGQYKFLAYYAWLGPDVRSILRTAITQPWRVLWHLIGPIQLITLLGLLLPFVYLPVLSLTTMVAALPVLIQMLLLGLGDSGLKIHYTALLTPILIYATLIALHRIAYSQTSSRLNIIRRNPDVAVIPLAVVIIASSIVIGPLGSLVQQWRAHGFELSGNRVVALAINKTLPARVAVLASFRPIQRLAQSDDVYSAHYIFEGHRQYTQSPYPVSDRVRTVVLDDRDVLLYPVIYQHKDFPEGYQRLRQFIDSRQLRLTQNLGHTLVYSQAADAMVEPALESREQMIDASLRLTAANQPRVMPVHVGAQNLATLPIRLQFRTTTPITSALQLQLTIADTVGRVQQELFALNPLLPTHDWPVNTDEAWTLRPVLARALRGPATVTAQVVKVTGEGGLDGLRAITITNQRLTFIGEPIQLTILPQ